MVSRDTVGSVACRPQGEPVEDVVLGVGTARQLKRAIWCLAADLASPNHAQHAVHFTVLSGVEVKAQLHHCMPRGHDSMLPMLAELGPMQRKAMMSAAEELVVELCTE